MKRLGLTAAVLILLLIPGSASKAAFSETESHGFADAYIEFLGSYADAGSEEEADDLRLQLDGMPSENPWLQQAVQTLRSAVDSLEKDPKASDAAVLQSALYVTKGLSDQTSDGRGFTHRLTKEERADLLTRLQTLQSERWIRSNETVATVAGLFADFLKRENT